MDDNFDSRLVKATANWMKGPIMEWLNSNNIEFVSSSRPKYWKSSKS
jgi:hypothetical protein